MYKLGKANENICTKASYKKTLLTKIIKSKKIS